MRKTHLKHNKEAIYKDIYIDGRPFQKSLKNKYPSEFSRGRYKEEFIPRIVVNKSKIDQSSGTRNSNVIAPIYGCHDNCCMYLFVEIEFTNEQVKWLRIAQDSAYLGKESSEMEPLVWLNGFKNLVFDKVEYERTFN